MIRVYLSGQITGTDDYIERFAAAEKKLTEQGYSVINPAKVNAQMPEDTTYDGYMEMSKAMLEQADCIFLMDGWQFSNGANLEMQWALNTDKMFMFEEKSYIRTTFLVANKAAVDRYAYEIGDKA